MGEWVTTVIGSIFAFALIWLGIGVFGAFTHLDKVENAAQFAAMSVEQNGVVTSALNTDLQNYGTKTGMTYTLTSSNPSGPAAYGETVWVKVTAPYQFQIPLVGGLWRPTLTVTEQGLSEYQP